MQIYRILANKSKILGDVVTSFVELQIWVFQFRRVIFDREIEALADLNVVFAGSGVMVAPDRLDQLVWQGCPSGWG